LLGTILTFQIQMQTRHLSTLTFAAGCLAATFLLPLEGAAHPELPAPTWDHVAPLMAERCVSCHRAGGNAALSLDTYDAARLVAGAIKRSVLDRRMPPWRAAPGFGEFANDPSLSAAEIELLAAWADGGARKGDGGGPPIVPPVDDPAPADVVLRPNDAYSIAGPRHTFELPLGNDRERWLRGWRFVPGNETAVTQAEVSIANAGPLGTWVPGDGATELPADAAYRLPRRATLVVDVRYRKMSAAASDASGVAIVFASKPRREVRHLTLPCGTTHAAGDLRILSVRPSIDSFGDAIEIMARRPDGAIAPLGWFRNYPPQFRATYRYRHPVSLPEASTIDVRSADGTCSADLEYLID
jgi:mono/diheme cytochrome c family protein